MLQLFRNFLREQAVKGRLLFLLPFFQETLFLLHQKLPLSLQRRFLFSSRSLHVHHFPLWDTTTVSPADFLAAASIISQKTG